MTRTEQFQQLFPETPAYRLKQIEQAFFVPTIRSWDGVTSLSKEMRAALSHLPWMTVSATHVMASAKKDTHKALLQLADGQVIESVLMENARGELTICVSSQVGCAMRCGFCATGKMGLKRSLTSDEIIDQYRFWQQFLEDRKDEEGLHSEFSAIRPRISNVVFMGMGEPLANYENVKTTLNVWLANTDLGVTRITVSTVGVLPRLEQMLTDKDWPHVRLAVSLHSAVAETRKQIVPTSYDDFLPKLADWARRYLKILGNRRHHLTFEYVMLKDVNDTDAHAKALAAFVHSIGNVRCNLIPYNLTDCEFTRSEDSQIARFLRILEDADVIATRRRTMGDDIAAACGQLIVLTKKSEASSD
ncbi:23S rRNA (adenine(2503)-C(2))-methyltransferase RlmN [bacterium]|nr:23S rRNA (adenine(2503)-C(2))-methyltransferase RlmN [bacterium]